MPEGYYHVEVADANGMTAEAEITLFEPDAFAPSIDINPYYYPNNFNTSCAFCSDGAIAVSVQGGFPPLSFQWADGAITQDRTGIPAGHYDLIISDANGCTFTTDEMGGIDITAPPRDDWTLNGNSNPTSASFIGTSVNSDVVFKRNNVEAIRMKSNGLQVKSLLGNSYSYVGVDSLGNLFRTGLVNPALSINCYNWTTCGNFSGGNSFIGTTSNNNLVFKSNNITGLTLYPSQDIRIEKYANSDGILISSLGFIDKIDFDSQDKILHGDGAFRFSPWKYIGTNIFSVGTGNVSIGGSGSPSHKLEVVHNSVVGGISLENLNSISWNSEIKFSHNSTMLWSIGNDVVHNGGHNFFIYDIKNSATRFIIDETGKVGIGCTPSNISNSLLQVEGRIAARSLKITSDIPFPDYVFEANYDLTSIKDLEKFIAERKHLPNLPSAEEVESDGLDVAKITTLLVEKLEEQALYIIMLQKQIDELKH